MVSFVNRYQSIPQGKKIVYEPWGCQSKSGTEFGTEIVPKLVHLTLGPVWDQLSFTPSDQGI